VYCLVFTAIRRLRVSRPSRLEYSYSYMYIHIYIYSFMYAFLGLTLTSCFLHVQLCGPCGRVPRLGSAFVPSPPCGVDPTVQTIAIWPQRAPRRRIARGVVQCELAAWPWHFPYQPLCGGVATDHISLRKPQRAPWRRIIAGGVVQYELAA